MDALCGCPLGEVAKAARMDGRLAEEEGMTVGSTTQGGSHSADAFNAVRFDPDRRSGHVESLFFKVNDSEGRRALWFKATVLSPKHYADQATASAWVTLFERGGENPVLRETTPFCEASFSRTGLDVRVADLHFSQGRIEGRVRSGGHELVVDLSYDGDSAPMVLLAGLMGDRFSWPRFKLASPNPMLRMSGFYELDGVRTDVDGWTGMQGHNWGVAHTPSYVWFHANQWHGGESVVVEAVAARARIGRYLSPPVCLALADVGGVRYRFNGLLQGMTNRTWVSGMSWGFEARGPGARMKGRVWAPPEAFVGLPYRNPDGTVTYCSNSMIAFAELDIDAGGKEPMHLTTRQAALEFGSPTPPPCVEFAVL